jgi:spore coat protein JB
MENNNNNCTDRVCDHKKGRLPSCAPLAAGYIPFQQDDSPKYRREDALAKGTLFPGLDLPWKNVSNAAPGDVAGTPLGELMTLGFVIQELGLYLDTHRTDREALDMYNEYVKLYNAGAETYVRRYGPLTQTQVTEAGYTWLNDPWPWEYAERRAD